jgi:hypothetical protein
MAATKSSNPLSDLMYDWLTVLQNKAEGLSAYEKYIQDAEAAGATACVEMLRKLHERDSQMVRDIKDHVFGMIAREKK